MGIVNTILKIVKSFADKRVCTVDQFMNACTVASKQASKDNDGYLNILETLKIVYTVYKASRRV